MSEKTLLSTKEHEVCRNLSSQRTLEGKRAKALLALNDGDTQVIAAKKSGLSYGQVKYLLTIFRKKGLALFPAISSEKKETSKVKKVKSKESKSKAKKKDKKKTNKKKDKKKSIKKTKEKSKSKKDKSKKSGKKKDKSKGSGKKKTKKSKKKK